MMGVYVPIMPSIQEDGNAIDGMRKMLSGEGDTTPDRARVKE
jgi:hypothetical protein